jgi:4-amino-4-deoxy-L-arabinose transferase-like glycosyltransferase
MSFQPVAGQRALPRTLAWPWAILSYLTVGLMSLLPRVLDLGVFLSGDESEFWLRRSDIFLQALRAHDWAATAVSTHPGVTTMWLGSIGLLLHNALTGSGLLTDQSFPIFLTLMRLPIALAHVATVLLGYALLRRMFAPPAALLGGLFWATDPFVVAFSRVLHVDALAGSFLTLSLLAACLYWHRDRRARWLVGSGVSAGLAILSKSPALALVPWVGLVALAAAATDERRPTTDGQRSALLVGGRWSVVLPLLAWAAICAATVFALWPALWVAPLRAYDQMRTGVEAEGAQPHMFGNFFLGREDDAPGPLF